MHYYQRENWKNKDLDLSSFSPLQSLKGQETTKTSEGFETYASRDHKYHTMCIFVNIFVNKKKPMGIMYR